MQVIPVDVGTSTATTTLGRTLIIRYSSQVVCSTLQRLVLFQDAQRCKAECDQPAAGRQQGSIHTENRVDAGAFFFARVVRISAAPLTHKPSALLPGGSAGVASPVSRFAVFSLSDLARYRPHY